MGMLRLDDQWEAIRVASTVYHLNLWTSRGVEEYEVEKVCPDP